MQSDISRSQAASMLNVSHRSVNTAKKVEELEVKLGIIETAKNVAVLGDVGVSKGDENENGTFENKGSNSAKYRTAKLIGDRRYYSCSNKDKCR